MITRRYQSTPKVNYHACGNFASAEEFEQLILGMNNDMYAHREAKLKELEAERAQKLAAKNKQTKLEEERKIEEIKVRLSSYSSNIRYSSLLAPITQALLEKEEKDRVEDLALKEFNDLADTLLQKPNIEEVRAFIPSTFFHFDSPNVALHVEVESECSKKNESSYFGLISDCLINTDQTYYHYFGNTPEEVELVRFVSMIRRGWYKEQGLVPQRTTMYVNKSELLSLPESVDHGVDLKLAGSALEACYSSVVILPEWDYAAFSLEDIRNMGCSVVAIHARTDLISPENLFTSHFARVANVKEWTYRDGPVLEKRTFHPPKQHRDSFSVFGAVNELFDLNFYCEVSSSFDKCYEIKRETARVDWKALKAYQRIAQAGPPYLTGVQQYVATGSGYYRLTKIPVGNCAIQIRDGEATVYKYGWGGFKLKVPEVNLPNCVLEGSWDDAERICAIDFIDCDILPSIPLLNYISDCLSIDTAAWEFVRFTKQWRPGRYFFHPSIWIGGHVGSFIMPNWIRMAYDRKDAIRLALKYHTGGIEMPSEYSHTVIVNRANARMEPYDDFSHFHYGGTRQEDTFLMPFLGVFTTPTDESTPFINGELGFSQVKGITVPFREHLSRLRQSNLSGEDKRDGLRWLVGEGLWNYKLRWLGIHRLNLQNANVRAVKFHSLGKHMEMISDQAIVDHYRIQKELKEENPDSEVLEVMATLPSRFGHTHKFPGSIKFSAEE